MEQKTPFEERLQEELQQPAIDPAFAIRYRRGSTNAKASWAMPGGVSASAGPTR